MSEGWLDNEDFVHEPQLLPQGDLQSVHFETKQDHQYNPPGHGAEGAWQWMS